MRAGKLITISVWLMILFNLLLSFGAVWSLQRMNPEIKRIYERNVVSLDACEKMLLALAEPTVDCNSFNQALLIAENNITEKGERETAARIRMLSGRINSGNIEDRRQLTREIIKLTNFNKTAIFESAMQAQKVRRAGAWSIVFMTLFFFTAALFFEQRLRRTLLMPLQEIAAVMSERLQGDRFRRCNLPHAAPEIKKLFNAINDLIDRSSRND
ncbi:MAG: hypothetical protein J6Q81_04430 [Lentisphaeria bacterium]|nr:hypothetical protein [Lentisphaeria bacterium]